MPKLKKVTLAVSFAFCRLRVSANEKPSTLADQQSVAVTIYNENLALVKDQRRIALEAGRNRLALREVSGRMRPETALLRSLSHPGSLTLLEQNFDFDLLTPAKLLEKYVGRDVRIVRTHPTTGAEIGRDRHRARGQRRRGAAHRRPHRDRPAGAHRLRRRAGQPARPADAGERAAKPRAPASRALELSYLTGGLAWKADYVAELNAADSALDLNGWVTLTNTSGTAVPEREAAARRGRREPRARRDAPRGAGPRRCAQLPRRRRSRWRRRRCSSITCTRCSGPTTIADNQTKQVALLSAQGVPVVKELLLQGTRLLLPLERRRHRPEDEGRRVRAVREPRVGAPGHADAEGRGARLQEGQRRQRAVRRRGPHRPHAEEREACASKLGEPLRRHRATRSRPTSSVREHAPTARATCSRAPTRSCCATRKKEAATVVVREPVPGDWTMLEESQAPRQGRRRHRRSGASRCRRTGAPRCGSACSCACCPNSGVRAIEPL